MLAKGGVGRVEPGVRGRFLVDRVPLDLDEVVPTGKL